MATQTLETLQQEVADLKARVTKLEHETHDQPQVTLPPPDQRTTADIIAWLRAKGLVVDLPEHIHQYAEQWRELSEEEKRQVRWELDHQPPGPMISDIIIENRR